MKNIEDFQIGIEKISKMEQILEHLREDVLEIKGHLRCEQHSVIIETNNKDLLLLREKVNNINNLSITQKEQIKTLFNNIKSIYWVGSVLFVSLLSILGILLRKLFF